MSNLEITHYDDLHDFEAELEVEINHYQPPVKGKYSGAWEDSYPDEPAEVEYSVQPIEYKYLEEDVGFMELVLDRISEQWDNE